MNLPDSLEKPPKHVAIPIADTYKAHPGSRSYSHPKEACKNKAQRGLSSVLSEV